MEKKRSLIFALLFAALFLVSACKPEEVITNSSEDEKGPETPVGPVQPADPDPMIVCTFNIRNANNTDKYPDGSSAAWSDRREAVKKFVDTVKPDLIGLQEIRKAQAEDFASFFRSDYGYYDVGRDSKTGASIASANCEGVGILFRKDRFELVKMGFFWLDENFGVLPEKNSDGTYGAWNSACRRVTVYVELKDKQHGNTPVYFFTTHYDHKSAVARRNAADLSVSQIKALCKVSTLKEADPVILHVGDLNATYISGQLQSLNDNMYYARLAVDGPDRSKGTYNGFGKSDTLIDHIYYGGKSIKPVRYWVDRTDYGVPFLSDHYPVLFQWEYR